ncbi:hypothetical protein FQN50_003242 [Emmonsiellopsis sp. PD_5]|nr:hypothetical protein FQN50_003242 [Emmonsiellopsis sp. PD_5]
MSAGNATSSSSSYSSFRNVSACNRCRLRKNRCDQNLPRCQSCEKARVHCVGYDPTTKREIPRSYVFFLESRVAYLEKTLVDNGIEFRPPEPFEGEIELENQAGPGTGSSSGEPAPEENGGAVRPVIPKTRKSQERIPPIRRDSNQKVKREREPDDGVVSDSTSRPDKAADEDADNKQQTEESERRIDNLVSNIGMVSVQGASDPRYLGSTSGISFARVVFTAVKSSVSTNASERGALKSSDRQGTGLGANAGGSSMRDSFFGLQAKPKMKQAPFPDQSVAERLVNLYFEHANPQIPILHRGDFMEVFHRVYSVDEKSRSSRDLYLLNIICAIGAGIIFDAKSDIRPQDQEAQRSHNRSPASPTQKRQKLLFQQYQPEEYHASAVVHLEAFLGSAQNTDGFGGGLEELQAVLLLASFALLRPVAPGLWYIIGVAVRLAIDLGLHYEDGTGIDSITEQEESTRKMKSKGGTKEKSAGNRKARLKIDPKERGRREWVRDLRRRLWWCTYCFDRLVSTCVGRPFGITDQVITTEFPSLLDDKYITKQGFTRPPSNATSYKHASHHYFKLRLLQSEIQQVLQHQQARMARKIGKNRSNAFMHTNLPSPFLANFDSFRSWRKDIHRRLEEWKDSAPKTEDIGVQFSVEFLELNYWQALIMLYRQSLVVPAPLAGELSPTEDVSSPSMTNPEDAEDEDDIYVKVAEAGQKVLRLYRQLHRVRLVNYTYLATHHLFMAGISFLYAIWHSPVVRSRLTLDSVDFTVLAATSVLGDLMEKCPPAEACRDAFERMSKATVQMCLSTTGFASDSDTLKTPLGAPVKRPVPTNNSANKTTQNHGNRADGHQSAMPMRTQQHQQQQQSSQPPPMRIPPQFDMGLHDLFPDDGRQQPQSQYHDSGHPIQRQNQYTTTGQYQTRQPYPTQHVKYEEAGSSQHHPHHAQHHQQPPPHTQPQHHQQYSYAYTTTPTTDPQTNPFNSSTLSPIAQHSTHQDHQQQQQQEYLSNLKFDMSPPTNHTNPSTSASTNNNPTTYIYDHPTVSSDSDGTGDINMMSIPNFSGPAGGGPAAGTGLDLGFGMAVDFQHDWSEGVQYDLFNGFFFGGGGYGGIGGSEGISNADGFGGAGGHDGGSNNSNEGER